jgi:hypothetical protein
MLQKIVNYMLENEWEFTLDCSDGDPAQLIIPLFDGKFILSNDGSWSFVED